MRMRGSWSGPRERHLCLGCGRVFDWPRAWEEQHGQPELPGERFSLSPCCGDGYVKAVRCARCGKWMARDGGHGLCGRCAGQAVGRLRRLLMDQFSREERLAVNEAFDGVPLTGPWEEVGA